MDTIDIPGFGQIAITHLVLDYNGTLAVDGSLVPGSALRIGSLAEHLTVVVLTADTFGMAAQELDGLPCEIRILPQTSDEARAKLAVINEFGAENCAAVGNGANDALMLEAARLGVAVIGHEGAAQATAASADMLVTSPLDAMDLLLKPLRLKAGLRR
jgi:soluble P-type ATPase